MKYIMDFYQVLRCACAVAWEWDRIWIFFVTDKFAIILKTNKNYHGSISFTLITALNCCLWIDVAHDYGEQIIVIWINLQFYIIIDIDIVIDIVSRK